MNKFILFISALTFAFVSCVDDEGNYSYHEINEVTIDSIETKYNVMAYVDELEITPEISSSEEGRTSEDYEYKWEICKYDIGSSSTHEHTVIGTEKDLKWTVDLAPATYNLYFYVKDKKTELETHVESTINVSTSFTRGFIVLGDLPEENELLAMDMLTMPAGRDTAMVENAFDNSELQLHNPSKMLFAGPYVDHTRHNQALWLLTDDDAYRLNTGDAYDLLGDFNGMRILETEVSHKQPMTMRDMFPHQRYGSWECASRSYRGYITDDMVVFASIMSLEYFSTPINRYSSTSSTYFRPYPYGFATGSTTSFYNSYGIFYDLDNDCFAIISSPYSYYVNKLQDRTGDAFLFDAKSEGRTLVYGSDVYYSNYTWGCMVMKDTSTNDYFIYRVKFPAYYYGASTKYCYPIDLSKVPDFDQASHYAFSNGRMAIVYSVGSRLYQYDYSRDMITSIDLGSEITYLESDYASASNAYCFLAATYDSQKKGEIYSFQIGTDANEVSFTINAQWSTRMRVKDMCWKNCK